MSAAPATSSSPSVARPTKPSTPLTTWLALAVVVAITVWSFRGVEFSLTVLFTEQATRGFEIIGRFFSPDWEFLTRVPGPLLETLYIAVIAATVGCALALPIALLSSKVTNRSGWLYGTTRTLLSIVRSLPDIAWGLLLVAMVSSGPLPGILALIFFNIGVVAKLTSETIDGVDLGPLEAADAAGASRTQRAWSAVVPQILPGYLSYSLYVFELNLRASVVLGYVGAGGIGNVIRVQLGNFQYERVGAVIFAVFVIVVVLDQASIAMRRRLV